MTFIDGFIHARIAGNYSGASLTGARVAQILDGLKATRGLPKQIVCDNGPEFTSRALEQCRLRDECLNLHWLGTLPAAQAQIEDWRIEFNTERPHSSLANKTPKQFAQEHYDRVAA